MPNLHYFVSNNNGLIRAREMLTVNPYWQSPGGFYVPVQENNESFPKYNAQVLRYDGEGKHTIMGQITLEQISKKKYRGVYKDIIWNLNLYGKTYPYVGELKHPDYIFKFRGLAEDKNADNIFENHKLLLESIEL